jgi:membrane protease YdiL (CAAX protease family)
MDALTTDRRARVSPIVALAVGVVLWFLPTFAKPLTDAMFDSASGQFVAVLVLRWIALALLLVFVFAVERRPAASVGIRSARWTHILLALAVAVVTVVVSYGTFFAIQGNQVDQGTQTGQIITSLPFIQLVHLVVNAAAVEEFFYRGFLIERLIDLTARPWLAGVISYVLFVAGHLAGSGVTATLTLTAIGALPLVGFYLWRRNIWLCAGIHAVLDLPILIAN